jgi:hypothetical protein
MKLLVNWDAPPTAALPDVVDVPDELFEEDEGAVADWLSDEHGFCVNG